MATEELPERLDVPLTALIELAIESWRLDSWLATLPPEKVASKLRHVARRLQKFLSERELGALDLTGKSYEPGMSVEVLEALEDERLARHERLIDEMVEPIILWRGRVVKYGRVVVRQGGKASPPA
ncbi:MAG: hypothetical protein QOG00_2996 [Pyrinomonadaceae bacterium]|nr:hypothetical protein [Pyrinomonadaceae bacterium]MDX6272772.1 hypothetical protein [Acidobacteriota bacterium]